MSGRERGQAQIEMLAAVPLLVAVAAVILQLLAAGHAQSLADSAAHAGAIARAAGADPERAALATLPGWARERARIETGRGTVAISVLPPSLIPGSRARISSSAWSRGAR